MTTEKATTTDEAFLAANANAIRALAKLCRPLFDAVRRDLRQTNPSLSRDEVEQITLARVNRLLESALRQEGDGWVSPLGAG